MNLYAAIAGSLTWAALILQFYITTNRAVEDGLGAWIGITRYFGYFTVLTNLLVALTLTLPLIVPHQRWVRFFARPGSRTAIAGYIIIVGLAYHFLLRGVWDPQGLQLVVHQTLHYVVPPVYVIFWALFVPKSKVHWHDLPSWFIYPLAYLILALFRGVISGWYPYPFLDVSKLGYVQVLLSSARLFLAFGIVSAGLIGIGRLMQDFAEK